VSRNLERERERERKRKAWAAFVWGRTRNFGNGGGRSIDGGGKISWGNNAVIIRPNAKTKKAMGGEPYGGHGATRKRRLPSKPYLRNLLQRHKS